MLAYRSTPLENGYSPAELLMGRKLRTTVPTTPQAMKPQLPDAIRLQSKDEKIKKRQKRNFDQRHQATDLKPLQKVERVWIPDRKSEGTVTVIGNCAPRSYIVETDHQGTYRRNRKMLLPLLSVQKTTKPKMSITTETAKPLHCPVVVIRIVQPPATQQAENSQFTQTRSGRISKPPDCYII